MSSEPSIAGLTAFDLAIRVHADVAEAAMVEESPIADSMLLLASLPSADSAIDSIWSTSENPYQHISAVKFEARAARARIGEAWWTRPTQRRGRAPSQCTYTSRDILSFATVSLLLPDAAPPTFSAVDIPAIAFTHAAAAPYVSGCRTHAQQLDHLYASIHEADVLLGLFLKLISDKPNGIVLCTISLL
jgi:hypothetical protein